MQIWTIGTAGFSGEYRWWSREWKPWKQTNVSQPLSTPYISWNSQVTPEVIVSTAFYVEQLLLPPASYVAWLYSQNQE